MKKCNYCGIEIEGRHSLYANHVRWCDKNDTNGDKGSKNISKNKVELYKKLYPINEYIVTCEICKSWFLLNERESKFKKRKGRYFCSKKCSNTRQWTEESKNKISISTKNLWKDEEYANKVIVNNTNRNRRFTSKGEEEIKKYLKETFNDDEWTSGGGFRYNDVQLTRDMYSNKLKVIVEYDGIWHFKNIHNQLEEKQMKDRLLDEWVVNNNWRIVRLKDELYRKNKDKWLTELIDCIYNRNESVIKLY